MIGIDLGTTNSAVAIMEGKVPRIIENSEGKLSIDASDPNQPLRIPMLTIEPQVPVPPLPSLPSPRMVSASSVSPPSARPSSTLRTHSSLPSV